MTDDIGLMFTWFVLPMCIIFIVIVIRIIVIPRQNLLLVSSVEHHQIIVLSVLIIGMTVYYVSPCVAWILELSMPVGVVNISALV